MKRRDFLHTLFALPLTPYVVNNNKPIEIQEYVGYDFENQSGIYIDYEQTFSSLIKSNLGSGCIPTRY